VREVRYLKHHAHLAVVDHTLSGGDPAPVMAAGEAAARAVAAKATTAPMGAGAISIDNFAFSPRRLVVPAGQRISWTNHDDVPHRIQSVNGAFPPSAVLDTRASYALTLPAKGEYRYFCSLHPTMTGTIIIE